MSGKRWNCDSNLEKKSIIFLQDSLQKDFGVKTGEMLWSYSRGLDLRSVTAVQVCLAVDSLIRFTFPSFSRYRWYFSFSMSYMWAYNLAQPVTWRLFYLQESKSIGAEVNWGVRFRDQQDVCILVNYAFFPNRIHLMFNKECVWLLTIAGSTLPPMPMQGSFSATARMWNDRTHFYS